MRIRKKYRSWSVAALLLAMALMLMCLLSGCAESMGETEGSDESGSVTEEESIEEDGVSEEDGVNEEGNDGGIFGILSSTEDINLRDTDGAGVNYAFTYNGEDFQAQYYYDNWTIFDSYKITNKSDMKTICQALIDVHTVHGKDYESFRTAKDMAYEWQQHNLAYYYLPEDNAWREHAKNVDFDPEDQGRSFKEIYEDRTGQEIDIEEYVKEKMDNGDLYEKMKEYLKEYLQ